MFKRYNSITNHYQQKTILFFLQMYPQLKSELFVGREKIDGCNIQFLCTPQSDIVKVGKRNAPWVGEIHLDGGTKFYMNLFGLEAYIPEVFEEIKLAGQVPHKIYSMGFSRLSCAVCINGKVSEHKQAGKLRPALMKKFMQLERTLGKTLRMKQRGVFDVGSRMHNSIGACWLVLELLAPDRSQVSIRACLAIFP